MCCTSGKFSRIPLLGHGRNPYRHYLSGGGKSSCTVVTPLLGDRKTTNLQRVDVSMYTPAVNLYDVCYIRRKRNGCVNSVCFLTLILY
jgi:hypothetical protein